MENINGKIIESEIELNIYILRMFKAFKPNSLVEKFFKSFIDACDDLEFKKEVIAIQQKIIAAYKDENKIFLTAIIKENIENSNKIEKEKDVNVEMKKEEVVYAYLAMQAGLAKEKIEVNNNGFLKRIASYVFKKTKQFVETYTSYTFKKTDEEMFQCKILESASYVSNDTPEANILSKISSGNPLENKNFKEFFLGLTFCFLQIEKKPDSILYIKGKLKDFINKNAEKDEKQIYFHFVDQISTVLSPESKIKAGSKNTIKYNAQQLVSSFALSKTMFESYEVYRKVGLQFHEDKYYYFKSLAEDFAKNKNPELAIKVLNYVAESLNKSLNKARDVANQCANLIEKSKSEGVANQDTKLIKKSEAEDVVNQCTKLIDKIKADVCRIRLGEFENYILANNFYFKSHKLEVIFDKLESLKKELGEEFDSCVNDACRSTGGINKRFIEKIKHKPGLKKLISHCLNQPYSDADSIPAWVHILYHFSMNLKDENGDKVLTMINTSQTLTETIKDRLSSIFSSRMSDDESEEEDLIKAKSDQAYYATVQELARMI